MSATEQAVQQEQLMARFVFAEPTPEGTGLAGAITREIYGPLRTGRPWQPDEVERALATVRRLFELAQHMADADEDPSVVTGEGWLSFLKQPGSARQERDDLLQREAFKRGAPLPLEVVSIRLGSLDVILAVSGVLASGKVLRYLFDLIEEAYQIRPRIRRERAVLEADRLDAELQAMKTKEELVRFATRMLDAAAPVPTSVDFWLGEGDEPPQLETEPS